MNTTTTSPIKRRRRTEFLLTVACLLFSGATFAQSPPSNSPVGDIRGTVTHTDAQRAATRLAGIVVKLTATSQELGQRSAITDAAGLFDFTGLGAATYSIEVVLDGFAPFSSSIVLKPGESRVEDVHMELAAVAMSIDVHGQAAEITAHTADPDTKLTEERLPALPMAQQKYSEALPVIPGVVRTINGTLNIKGEVANQGMLLVDSAQMVDPVTGSFSVGVPLASVDSLNVYESPYNAQYGGFSGGLSTIETKAPPSQWQYQLMDFVPGIRMKNGQISGVSAETPRAFVGGPLVKDKVTISEAFDYTIKNRPVRGQPWPVNENRLRGFNSYTNVQAVLSPKHLLTGSVSAFSDRVQFADINALVPQTASSNSGTKGAFATVSAADQLGFGTLNTTFRYTRFDSNAYGQGDKDLLMTPEGFGGNAFNRWKRTSNQYEFLPTLQLQTRKWHGIHEVKIGADVIHQNYDGTTHSDPIQVLREDGSLAERIDFVAANRVHGASSQVAEFVQDHWVLSDRLAIDTGVRMTTQTNGRSAAFAPRTGVTYGLGADRKTVLRAGSGVFYDRVPMLAATFPQNPARVLTLYNANGSIAGGPTVFQNAFVDFGGAGPTVRTAGDPGTSPRNLTWNLEAERELNSRATLKVSYLQSQTRTLFVVNPWERPDAESVLGLSPTGNSHYREFQTSVHYRAGRRADLSVAYLRSQAKGSLNTLSATYVPFEQPIIRPNVNDYLDSDIPNRLLGSGVFHLPAGFTISPVMDWHTGFRYSNVDVLNEYVGRPNSQRLPTYFSLDAKIYRDFKLPAFVGRLTDHRLRIGIYMLNATNHDNPHDVYNNVTSPVFGHFVGFQHRVDGILIDIVK